MLHSPDTCPWQTPCAYIPNLPLSCASQAHICGYFSSEGYITLRRKKYRKNRKILAGVATGFRTGIKNIALVVETTLTLQLYFHSCFPKHYFISH